jgi:hypothetical protein
LLILADISPNNGSEDIISRNYGSEDNISQNHGSEDNMSQNRGQCMMPGTPILGYKVELP